jgi:hypothetical protein
MTVISNGWSAIGNRRRNGAVGGRFGLEKAILYLQNNEKPLLTTPLEKSRV